MTGGGNINNKSGQRVEKVIRAEDLGSAGVRRTQHASRELGGRITGNLKKDFVKGELDHQCQECWRRPGRASASPPETLPDQSRGGRGRIRRWRLTNNTRLPENRWEGDSEGTHRHERVCRTPRERSVGRRRRGTRTVEGPASLGFLPAAAPVICILRARLATNAAKMSRLETKNTRLGGSA